MKRMMLILCILLAMAILAHSKSFVQLGGSGGTSLLQDLTNNSTTITSSNNTTINLSHSADTMQLEGAGGTGLFENLTNETSSGDNNTTDDLNSWGHKPRPPPPPPKYDQDTIKTAEMNSVIRQNHLGY